MICDLFSYQANLYVYGIICIFDKIARKFAIFFGNIGKGENLLCDYGTGLCQSECWGVNKKRALSEFKME